MRSRTRWIFSFFALVVGASTCPARAQTRRGGVQLSSARDRAAALQTESVGGPFNAVCTATTLLGSNVMANCDSVLLPHNETAIIADPNNANHLAAGSNDTQLPPNGASGSSRSALGYYTSFDGGRSWINGAVTGAGFAQASDPALGFGTWGDVFIGMVSFDLGRGGQALGGAIQVARSTDGGRTFGTPVTVEVSTSDGIQEDKPYLVVDTNSASPFANSIYVTWTRFHFDALDNYLESPIFFSASRDGGQTWSAPKEISGSNPTACTFTGTRLPFDNGRCKEDQFSSPVVAADGTIFVAFENEQAVNDGEFRDQYLLVKSTDGGETWSAPVRASDIIHDGADDYPINIVGRQTLSNSQFRVNSAGNLAVDAMNGTLVVVWSDNRNGTAASTNTDILFVRSTDGGTTWSAPAMVSRVNDQFYPWSAFAPDGTLNISFYDRSYDPANSEYGMTLARLGPRARSFTLERVDTGLSDPNHARWFSGATGGKTIFIGDYNGLAVGSDGVARPFWTDMRRVVTVKDATGHTEDVFTVAVP